MRPTLEEEDLAEVGCVEQRLISASNTLIQSRIECATGILQGTGQQRMRSVLYTGRCMRPGGCRWQPSPRWRWGVDNPVHGSPAICSNYTVLDTVERKCPVFSHALGVCHLVNIPRSKVAGLGVMAIHISTRILSCCISDEIVRQLPPSVACYSSK